MKGFWTKLEKFEKTMEKWHNKIYKYVCIVVFIIIADIIGAGILGWSLARSEFLAQTNNNLMMFMYDFIVYVGSPILFIFICYTILFTRFGFPIRFKGNGGGSSIKSSHYT